MSAPLHVPPPCQPSRACLIRAQQHQLITPRVLSAKKENAKTRPCPSRPVFAHRPIAGLGCVVQLAGLFQLHLEALHLVREVQPSRCCWGDVGWVKKEMSGVLRGDQDQCNMSVCVCACGVWHARVLFVLLRGDVGLTSGSGPGCVAARSAFLEWDFGFAGSEVSSGDGSVNPRWFANQPCSVFWCSGGKATQWMLISEFSRASPIKREESAQDFTHLAPKWSASFSSVGFLLVCLEANPELPENKKQLLICWSIE